MARKISPTDSAIATGEDNAHIPPGPPVDRDLLMPDYRERRDGWTRARTQRFFDTLAHTGCARDAARVAGLSNQSGYKLKARFPAFSAAWDAAVARSQPGLIALAYTRAIEGKETVIIRKGEEYERRISPSDAMLALLVKRGDLSGTGMAVPEGHIVVHRDECVTRAEAEEGAFWMVERGSSCRVTAQDANEARTRVLAELAQMRDRLLAGHRPGM